MRVVRLGEERSLSELPRDLGLPDPAPVVVLVGGAGSLGDARAAALRRLFEEGLAAAVEQVGGVLVDGGTDAGVMRLAGRSRAAAHAHFPLVGVAAAKTVVTSGSAKDVMPDAAPAEPNHSHMVLVPGERFGDESPWISDVAAQLAESLPSVTLLVGGGEVAWEDVENSVAAGRPVLVLEGSGGTADAIAHGISTKRPRGRVGELAATGRFTVVSVDKGPKALRAALEAALGPNAKGHDVSPPPVRDEEESAVRGAIASLALSDAKRRFLEVRWLGQIQWMERKAATHQRWYYWSRRIIIVSSALAPVLMASASALPESSKWPGALRVASIVIGLIVAIAAAWEEFFRNGERWRHYRATIEELKSEGWLFLEQSGPYSDYPSHARAHGMFVTRVEQIFAREAQRFVTHVTAEKEKQASASNKS